MPELGRVEVDAAARARRSPSREHTRSVHRAHTTARPCGGGSRCDSASARSVEAERASGAGRAAGATVPVVAQELDARVAAASNDLPIGGSRTRRTTPCAITELTVRASGAARAAVGRIRSQVNAPRAAKRTRCRTGRYTHAIVAHLHVAARAPAGAAVESMRARVGALRAAGCQWRRTGSHAPSSETQHADAALRPTGAAVGRVRREV